MRQEAAHRARRVVLGQAVGGEDVRKTRVVRAGETVVRAAEPIDARVGLPGVHLVVHRRFQRLVVRGHRAIFQPLGDVEPGEAVVVEHERGVAPDGFQTDRAGRRRVAGRFRLGKIRHVETGPFAFFLVPPDELLALAPRFAIRLGAGAIVDDAAVTRPRETPAVTVGTVRLAAVALVDLVRAVAAGVNPAARRGAAVVLQSEVIVELTPVVRGRSGRMKEEGGRMRDGR